MNVYIRMVVLYRVLVWHMPEYKDQGEYGIPGLDGTPRTAGTKCIAN